MMKHRLYEFAGRTRIPCPTGAHRRNRVGSVGTRCGSLQNVQRTLSLSLCLSLSLSLPLCRPPSLPPSLSVCGCDIQIEQFAKSTKPNPKPQGLRKHEHQLPKGTYVEFQKAVNPCRAGLQLVSFSPFPYMQYSELKQPNSKSLQNLGFIGCGTPDRPSAPNPETLRKP